MDQFIEGQRRNIEQVRRTRHFLNLIGALDVAYRGAIDAVPRLGVLIIFGRILLICHKPMLSAATLIAQGQPEDSTGITRRAVVHFTPEFHSSLDWEVNRTSEVDGKIYLNYFQRSQREIERHLIALAAAHLMILEALDRCCDGRFHTDDSCRERLAEFVSLGKGFNESYRRRYGTGEDQA